MGVFQHWAVQKVAILYGQLWEDIFLVTLVPTGEGWMNKGLDLARPNNYNILAAADGIVIKAGYTSGFGNWIEIQHSFGMKQLYELLSSINAMYGQKVSSGTVIGIMGTIGNSKGVYLHFEVYKMVL